MFLILPAMMLTSAVGAEFVISDPQLVNRAESRFSLPECPSVFTYLGEAVWVDFTLEWDGDEEQRPEIGGENLIFDILLDPEDENIIKKQEVTVGNWNDKKSRVTLKITTSRQDPTNLTAQLTVSIKNIADHSLRDAPVKVGTTQLRLGRLRLDNDLGARGPLVVRWQTEYWDDEGWMPNIEDECTAFNPADVRYRTTLTGEEGSALPEAGSPVPLNSHSLNSHSLAGRLSNDDENWRLDLSGGAGKLGFRRLEGDEPDWLEVRFDPEGIKDVFGEVEWARLSFGLHAGDRRRVFTLEP
ncbi:DUF6701 domain-containing protein [Ectothiorhodospira shaposhnikovii]|uniref:DUF6701 domain-containing protein n=1 Tax=Ectothiorhodospira shaposhnikovii TaxID=1054 RepID=UPI001EE93E0C|nr:DUF6701 domain-containing protein [Ectothiorhodospira shaposhnikovii]MCG5514381.1 hypothetical protein [Ectothiorhodospira shaposhnikovii]